MNKTLIAIIVLAVVVILGFWLFNKPAQAPNTTGAAEVAEDTTASINQQLDSVNVTDLNKEFEAVDTELNNL